MTPLEAGIAGTKEIFFAVISTTLTLAVVFLPLLFMGGLSGRLFREFGVTIAGAVLISALVALTLTPMLSVAPAEGAPRHGWLFRQDRAVLRGLERGYARGLARFLQRRWVALALLAAAARLDLRLAVRCVAARARADGRSRPDLGARHGVGGRRLRIHAALHGRAGARDGRAGARGASHDDAGARVPAAWPGVQGAVNTGFVRLFLKDKSERERSQAADRRRSAGLARTLHRRARQHHAGSQHRRAPRERNRRAIRRAGVDLRAAARRRCPTSSRRRARVRCSPSSTAI